MAALLAEVACQHLDVRGLIDRAVGVEGVGLRAGYALSDAVALNITYNYGWRIDKSLGTGGVGAIAINPLEKYQLFMADLNLKF